jgi:hypothetical protein
MRPVAKENELLPKRPQAVAWRILSRHTEWCEGLAKVLKIKCRGELDPAKKAFAAFMKDFGKYDYELDTYFDFYLAYRALISVVRNKEKIEQIM